MIEEEIWFSPSKSCIPAKESDSTSGAEICQIMFAEIDVVVGSDDSNVGFTPSGSVINALARVAAGSCASNDRGRQTNKFAFDRHGQVLSPTGAAKRRAASFSSLGIPVVSRHSSTRT